MLGTHGDLRMTGVCRAQYRESRPSLRNVPAGETREGEPGRPVEALTKEGHQLTIVHEPVLNQLRNMASRYSVVAAVGARDAFVQKRASC